MFGRRDISNVINVIKKARDKNNFICYLKDFTIQNKNWHLCTSLAIMVNNDTHSPRVHSNILGISSKGMYI